MGPCSKLAKHTVKLSFAATREEKDKRSKRTRLEIGFMSSGERGNRGMDAVRLKRANLPDIYWDLSEVREAGACISLSTGILRLADSRRTWGKVQHDHLT